MADSYTKLFSDIVDSSIWNEDAETCKVWITLLALCNNSDGYVRGSAGWLAGKAKVSKEGCEAALLKFSAPDPHSRTPDHDGKRIEVLEDGWLILNYMVFRDRLSTNPIAIKTRERVRKHRERYNALRNVTSVTERYSDSDSDSDSSLQSPKGGIGGNKFPEVEVPSWPEVQVECQKTGLVEWRARDWFDEMQQCGWKDNKNREVMDWRAYLARVRTWWERDGRPAEPTAKSNGKHSVSDDIKNQSALVRVEDRLRAIRGHFPLSDINPMKEEFKELKTERDRLKKLLGFKA